MDVGINGADVSFAPTVFTEVFERREIKYHVSREKMELIMPGLLTRMGSDKHGAYTVCNIYFDTPDFALIRRSIEKPVFKEKMRLRSYNVPQNGDSTVFLELKKKYRQTVYKRRAPMTLRSAADYLTSGAPSEHGGQIMKEIDRAFSFYGLVPKIYIAYDRIALAGLEDPSLRITFDSGIRYRTDDLCLTTGTDGIKAHSDGYIMEVKVRGAMPVWLSRTLSELDIFPSSFSKYGSCYRMMCGEDPIRSRR